MMGFSCLYSGTLSWLSCAITAFIKSKITSQSQEILLFLKEVLNETHLYARRRHYMTKAIIEKYVYCKAVHKAYFAYTQKSYKKPR